MLLEPAPRISLTKKFWEPASCYQVCGKVFTFTPSQFWEPASFASWKYFKEVRSQWKAFFSRLIPGERGEYAISCYLTMEAIFYRLPLAKTRKMPSTNGLSTVLFLTNVRVLFVKFLLFILQHKDSTKF